MKDTIVLPAGTTHVPVKDIPRMLAQAKFPHDKQKREQFEKLMWADMLEAIRSGELRPTPNPGKEQ